MTAPTPKHPTPTNSPEREQLKSKGEPIPEREANRPTVDNGKLLVFIVTPMRHFPGPEKWEAMTIEQKAEIMPPAVRKALHELSHRGKVNHEGVEGIEQDKAFCEQADKYTFEWAVAVGGLCRARNGAVHEFMKAKGHFLIWWDSDLEPDGMTSAEAILRLLSHRVPIVGGLYCKRAKRPQWVASFMPAAEMQKEPDRLDLLQMNELGGGFKCYFWRTFDEMKRKYPKLIYRDRDTGEKIVAYYQNLNLDGDFLSEDYWLDYLSRCAPIAIWADTRIRLRHHEDGIIYPPGAFPPIQALYQAQENA